MKNITRRYPHNQRPALEGVSLEASRGERLLISGPSGSGKTTLLNLIAGLDRPDSGTIEVLGRDITRLAESERAKLRGGEIGVVFQHHLLPPGLSAEEVVAAPLLWSRGMELDAALDRARQLLIQLELTDAEARRPVQRLSGGQRQRVAFARAVAPNPPLLLADEPTAQLDDHTREILYAQLMDWSEAGEKTLVLVSHERLPEAIAGEFRVFRIENGCAAAVG